MEAELGDRQPWSEEFDGLLDVREITKGVHLVGHIRLHERSTILHQGPRAPQNEQRGIRPARVTQQSKGQQNAARRE